MTRRTDDLKYQIERILGWEPSTHWRPRDFVHLSDLVYARTHVRLDAGALGAFWQLQPTIYTLLLLDTLAQFADYTDWDDFCARNYYGDVYFIDDNRLLHRTMWEIPTRWVIRICWLSIIAALAVGILLVWKR